MSNKFLTSAGSRIAVLGGAVLIGLMASTAALAADYYSGRKMLGEVWVFPTMFEQALAPLAPLTERAVKGGLCPGIKLGPDNLIHAYQIDTKLVAKGRGTNRRWEVGDLKIVNPSSCEALDVEVASVMREAIPQFVEPGKDLDGNGWYRIPGFELRSVN